MAYALGLIVLTIAYRALKNYLKWKRTAGLQQMYNEWLVSRDPAFYGYRSECLRLFRDAQIADVEVPYEKDILGIKRTGYSVVTANFPCADPMYIEAAGRSFEEAKGEFLRRVKETASPFYWIEEIAFFPRTVFRQLNADESTFYKVIQFLWWVIPLTLFLWREDISAFVSGILLKIKEIRLPL